MTAHLAGLVLAGGRSARFGRDKLSVPVAMDGTTLLDRAVACCRAACDGPVLIASGDGVSRPDLADGQVGDLIADAGPLSALAAGLAVLADRATAVAVVAGDHVAPSADVIALLAGARGDAAVALVDLGRAQPLMAVWSVALAPDLVDDVLAGARSPTDWLAGRDDVVRLDAAALDRAGLDAAAFDDVDVPGDLPPQLRAGPGLPTDDVTSPT